MSDENRLPFSPDEYAGRRERAVELMKQAGLDAIVLTSTPNYYYLCGLPIMVSLGVLALVLRADGAGFWIGRRMEMSNVSVLIEKTGWSEIARPIADDEDQYVVFGQALAGLVGPAARVGFEMDARTIAPAGVTTIAREAAGLEIRPSWRIAGPRNKQAGFEAAGQFLALKDRPTAACCWNDLVAIGLMNGIARAGLVPGIDISVTGYDDLEEAAIATPALTTVWNGQREVGRRAASALLDKLNGEPVHISQDLIKPELHVRQSTGRPVERR